MTDPVAQQQVGVLGVLAFLVELAMIALLAVAGWRLGSSTLVSLLLAVAFVVVAVAVWSRWMAPRSDHRLVGSPRAAAATGLFVATAVVALLAGISPLVAIAFAVVGGAVFVATRNA